MLKHALANVLTASLDTTAYSVRFYLYQSNEFKLKFYLTFYHHAAYNVLTMLF